MLLKMAVLSALRRPKRAVLIVLGGRALRVRHGFVAGWVAGMRDRMNREILQESAHVLIERGARLDAWIPCSLAITWRTRTPSRRIFGRTIEWRASKRSRPSAPSSWRETGIFL